jgi:alkaline phosphatase
MLLACTPGRQISEGNPIIYTGEKAKNVIFMVGDGMGIAQITAAMYSHDGQMSFEKFPVTGLHKNSSSDDLITDSAAGATAFSIGRKTYNGAIGVDAKGKAHKTLLEEAEGKGLSTGMIATSTITHATPASFAAHQPSRKLEEEIAADYMKTDIDLILGGGMKYFARRKKDQRDLVEELKSRGYTVDDFFQTDFEKLVFDPSAPLAYFTANEAPLPASEGRDYLEMAVARSLPFLKARSETGFFAVIEGSQIDWGGHANMADYIISETLDFNKAIEQALEFARLDGQTLVVVTADHETGGLAINKGSTRDTLITSFTSDYHTLELIPVFAYGPGSDLFSGIYENTDIFHKIRAAFGW